MIWLDAEDPDVRAAVLTGKWGSSSSTPEIPDPDSPVDTVAVALEVASEILTHLTGFKVHPGGESVEEFTAYPGTYRLTPNYLPIHGVTSLERLDEADCTLAEVTDGFCIFGQSVYFSRDRRYSYADWLWAACGSRRNGPDRLRMTYTFGSTITSNARRCVIYLANQLYLEAEGSDECQLPTRTSTVMREGIQYSIMNADDFLARAKTGLPQIDLWLAAVNPRRALRPARVVTPDAPAAVGVAIRTIRA